MVLNYIALAMLIFVFLVIFYGVLILHDIPYEIAKKRNHPHLDAIHVAGWVSLFTLHALWPFCGYGQRYTVTNRVGMVMSRVMTRRNLPRGSHHWRKHSKK